MIYVDDRLPTHPKILKTGALIGPNGPALSLALFVTGLAYARMHLTDGFLPNAFVTGSGILAKPHLVAGALVTVGLWRRVEGGFQIHDFADWNKSATEIKENRAKEREKKRRQRQAALGLVPVSLGVSPWESERTSRARASTTTYHGPRQGRTTDNTLEAVPSRVLVPTSKNLPPRAARRDSHAMKNATEADRIPAAVRDCARSDSGESGRNRERTQGPREGPPGRPRVRLSATAGHADARAQCGRTAA